MKLPKKLQSQAVLINSEHLLNSLDASAITAEAGEREAKLRGVDEHLKKKKNMGVYWLLIFYHLITHKEEGSTECITLSKIC